MAPPAPRPIARMNTAMVCRRARMRLLLRRRRHVAGMALARRIDVRPGARGRGPDVAGDFHAARVVERPRAHHDEAGPRIAMAVDRRAASAAEVAAQRAAALRRRVVVVSRLTLGDLERVFGHDGIDGAAGARRLLAVLAVAGAQACYGRGDRVADGAAKAAAGKRGSHIS